MRQAQYIADAIQQGAALLQRYHPFWSFNAFTAALAPTGDFLAPISNTTQALDEDALWQLDGDEQLQAEYFGEHFADLFAWQTKHLPPKFISSNADATDSAWPFWLHTDIPGRKWQQIQAFCQQLPNAHAAIEWCAGKGHLGRAYSWRHQANVTSLEYQGALCEQGQALAKKVGVNQTFIQADIYQLPLAQPPSNEAPHSPLWLAMHACGALHVQFLQSACVHNARYIALAPCCYHRQHGRYAPMSAVANDCDLILDSAALRLAQQNQVTAGASERAQRAKELRWRLGYEQLRQHTQDDKRYRPLPSVKVHRFSDFTAFCEFASAHHQAPVATAKCNQYEELGEQARLRMLRLDAIRHCFRRPLELWLLLDKMAYLVQQDYSARALQFCANTDTPRNLLLLASKNEAF